MGTTLVVLAAGLGSRFGGNKQISHVGPHGEILMEYSVHDAIAAGFSQIVFIIKRDMIEEIRNSIGAHICDRVRVDYVVQDTDTLPAWYKIPDGRVKPFGTVHAVLCAADVIEGPFATVNADDYYGKEAFFIMHRLLSSLNGARDAAMVPYILGNTMSENGGVTRGICTIQDGRLLAVEETRNILYASDGRIVAGERELLRDAMVSMNMWGFHKELLPHMRAYFEEFLRTDAREDISAECLLPVLVGSFLARKALSVTACPSEDKWFGITYREDRAYVMERLNALHDEMVYPERLFEY